MKKSYVKPVIAGERFTADEYVAMCEKETYKFPCNVTDMRDGELYRYREETDEWIREVGIHACGEVADITFPLGEDEELCKGFLDTNRNARKDSGDKDVVYWFTTPEKGNLHATTLIRKEDWEKSKS